MSQRSRSRKSSGLNKREREGGIEPREGKQGFNIVHFVVNSHREPAALKNPFLAPSSFPWPGGFRAKSASRVSGLPTPAERPERTEPVGGSVTAASEKWALKCVSGLGGKQLQSGGGRERLKSPGCMEGKREREGEERL